MKLSTAFSVLVQGDFTPPLPALPSASPKHLTAGFRQADGSIAVFATLNIESCTLSPERRNSILRTFQVMAGGVGDPNFDNVLILERNDAPAVITEV